MWRRNKFTYSKFVSIDCPTSFHNLLCYNTFGVWLYHMFPHYILKYTIFRKGIVKLKWTLWTCLKILNDTFLFKGIILREVVINVLLSLCKLPDILIGFREARNFFNISCKNDQTTFFFDNPLSGSRVTRCGLTDGRTAITNHTLTFLKFVKRLI
jgi:hypothetical protein